MRTYYGTIAKIEDIEFDIRFRIQDTKPLYVHWKEDFGGAYKKEELIVKHSKNIIDLIEVGDYVNGKRVIGKAENNLETIYICLGFNETIHNENEIKSIVTKEQYKSVEYVF